MACLAELSEKGASPGLALTRDELVVGHLPLVKLLVDRTAAFLPAYLDRDDLRSVASIGLISAAERFDPERGVQFKTFAERHIRGAIIDHFRVQDSLPRGLRGELKRMEREVSLLEHRLGRTPYSDEVALSMGLGLEDYYRLLNEIHQFSLVRLDDVGPEEDGFSNGFLNVLADKQAKSPQEQLIDNQTVQLLADAIDKLSKNERLVVTLYYYQDLTLKEIGSVLNLSEPRISQIHAKTLQRLRRKLARLT